jgi:hypothetical protein
MIHRGARKVSGQTTLFTSFLGVRLGIALAAFALALAAAAPASAAELSLTVAPAAGVRLGNPIELSGRATDAGVPLAGRTVRLELRRHPFTGPWWSRGSTVTGADGDYSFAPELDRNHQVRARLVGVAPEPDTLSPERPAYVLPAFTLTYRQHRPGVLRLRQTYTVPRDAHLSAPTRFYVGPCRPNARKRCTARRAPFRVAAATRRVRAGRYVAKATARIPRSYGGRFQYVSCFVYSPGSGMGDPEQRCPRRFAVIR